MSLIHPFRISLYVSLALALLGLSTATWDLLPEFPLFILFSFTLLGVAFWVEGRWELSLKDANLFGFFLTALLGLWGIFQFIRKPTGLGELLPWPASVLPYLTPVLLILIPAKLFRPKHIGDYWAMHGLGLVAVSMACAMANDVLFFVIFGLYVMSLVWALVTFQLYREMGPDLSASVPFTSSPWRDIKPSLVWALLAGMVAIPLFWLTPRGNSHWELGLNNRNRFLVGINEGPLDLDRSGTLEENKEKVFEVYAETKQREPYLELPPNQKWRVTHLQFYQSPRWQRDKLNNFQTASRGVSPPGGANDPLERLPNLGPDEIFLHYAISQRISRNQPLAYPVFWLNGQLTPIVAPYPDGTYRNWVHRHDSTFDGMSATSSYIQVWLPPSVAPPFVPMWIVTDYQVLQTPTPGLHRLNEYAAKLVKKFVEEKKLPQKVLEEVDPVTRLISPKYHADVARLFEHHLAASGEFSYTTRLSRIDSDLDPNEDFLFNSRVGHCQRFASALTLLLRAVGIPSQLVLGYAGCESRGDGWYDVRENHAHAWVEVLVPATQTGGASPAPPPLPFADKKPELMRWLVLDPTPVSDEEVTVAPDSSLLDIARQKWQETFKTFFLSYNSESRTKAIESFVDWLKNEDGFYWIAFGVGAVIIGVGLLRSRKRRQRLEAMPTQPLPELVSRLVVCLERLGEPRQPGQTLREYAVLAHARLQANPLTDAFASLPLRIIEAYYAQRFGSRPMPGEEAESLQKSLKELEEIKLEKD
jgi:transglutaminase-like putative cysteine protease